MPSSKDKDVVDVDDRSREKRHRSKSERKEKERDRDRDRDRDRERDRDGEKERDRERRRDKDRDTDRDRGEKDSRDKDRDRERDRDRDRDSIDRDKDSSVSQRHRSSRSSKLRPTDSDSHSRSHRRHRVKEIEDDPQYRTAASSSMTDLVPELRRGLGSERGSIPYPTFSKVHSKEFLHSREDVSAAPRRTDPLTPEATDLGASEIRRSKSVDSPPTTRKPSVSRKESHKSERPPSPPETDLSGQKKRSGTPASVREEERHGEERPSSRDSSYVSRSTSKAGKSKISMASSLASSQRTFILPTHPPARGDRAKGAPSEVTNASTVDSAATSVLPNRNASGRVARPPPPLEVDSSPESVADSSPKTPMTVPHYPPGIVIPSDDKRLTGSDMPTPIATPAPGPPPPPPPPPPPLFNMQDVPRVDYLMQNGGLPSTVPRKFLAVLPRQSSGRPSNHSPPPGAENLFTPFFSLLNQYQSVLSGNGSIAVATGHKTIARRLLDRLENVFSRDLSTQGCSCVMCSKSDEPHIGLGWGEVLERVSGRIDLPQWPPFDLALVGSKAQEGLVDIPARPASPVKMDPDIAEEFREHYLRQTKRVRAAVDKWMLNCDKAPAPPPQEIDDETLTFAILTNLEPEDRPFFNALLSGSRDLHPATRAPTPLRRPRNDFVVRTGLSLQRLYRLPQAPRDAETAVYLVKNPALHDLLYTISDINSNEWEILISGRFDGFLWAGNEDDGGHQASELPSRGQTPANGIFPANFRPGSVSRNASFSRGPTPANVPYSRGPTPANAPYSRGPTPANMPYSRGPTPANGMPPISRGQTPASFISGMSVASSSYPSRTAVSHDEETEIAALAELEREIFTGMEALEDAFEKLHEQAMAVRDNLRRRGAALSMSLQQRRGVNGISVLPLSGSSSVYDRPAWADDDSTDGEGPALSDWGGDDASELAPDDSASQISSNRHRRPKRRKERATPALIEEEEEP